MPGGAGALPVEAPGSRARSASEAPLGLRYAHLVPLCLILAPMMLSLGAWMLPINARGLTGFMSRAEMDWAGAALVLPWIVAVVAVATVAFTSGVKAGPLEGLSSVGVDAFHKATVALGAVGTGWLYYTVTGGSAGRLVEMWTGRQFFQFQDEVSYGAGPLTLRYASVLAGGLAIARILSGRRLRRLDVVSLILLAATVLAVSRISAVMALCSAFSVLLFTNAGSRVRAVRLGVLLIACIGVFVAASYSRNAGFYENAGVSNPLQMTALDAQSYLATPTQVTWTVASSVARGEALPSSEALGALGPAIPAYALPHLADNVAQVGATPSVEGRYQNAVDLTISLTTNGVFTDTLMIYGWWGLLSALGVLGLAGFVIGRFVGGGEVGAAVAGVGLYGFAETWRVFLFNAGSVHFLFILGGLAALAGSASLRRRAPESARGSSSAVAGLGRFDRSSGAH